MPLLTMRDAAYPRYPAPLTNAVGYYIGGNTPHVWTNAEVKADPAQYHLPIWVRSQPPFNAQSDAMNMINWLRLHGAPPGISVVIDLETAVQPNYVQFLSATLAQANYPLITYGSEAFIFRNGRPTGGIWVASYLTPPYPHLVPGSVATQYRPGGPWDYSIILDSVKLWNVKENPMPNLTGRVVTIAVKPDQSGYWLVAADGGIFSFGNVQPFKPAVNVDPHGNKQIVGAVTTPSGNGLLIAGADGGVFAYGDAQYYGSIPAMGIGPAS